MLTERLVQKFGYNEPIFTDEILELFSEYSRVQVFRYVKKAETNYELIQFSKGVYYVPRKTFFGTMSVITSDSVMEKRYLKNECSVYGVYSGMKLLNAFSITTQMPAVIEIVSNNESMRCREVELNGRRFVLRKSRCSITEKNYAAYTILQLFNDFENDDKLNLFSTKRLQEYVQKQNITMRQLTELASFFPSRVSKRLIESGFINELALR